MRGILLALFTLCLLPGCYCSCLARNDADCGCCYDGSSSPKYYPPGPWWTRPDCGCPCKCSSYQEQRCSQVEDAKQLMVVRDYR